MKSKILVITIKDSVNMVPFYEELLESAGHTFKTCTYEDNIGEIAVNFLPQIVVLDFNDRFLDKITDFLATQHQFYQKQNLAWKLLFIGSSTWISFPHPGIEKHVTEWLGFPFDPDDFFEILDRLLEDS